MGPLELTTPFESIRHLDEHGQEFWSARELAKLLTYKWQNLESVVNKAKIACYNSGNPMNRHFTDVSKVTTGGRHGHQTVDDMHLTRYACYLIAQNADPSKEIVAQAQTYFAVQTRRQEEGDTEIFDDPEEALEEWRTRAIRSFMSRGYSQAYATNRVDAILSRKNITRKWVEIGVTEEEIAILTDQMHMGTFDLSVDAHKELKGFPAVRVGTIIKHKGNLRPALTTMEMAVLTFAENVTLALHEQRHSQGFPEASRDVDDGAASAKGKRVEIERITGQPVVSARNMLTSPDGGIFGDLGEPSAEPPKEGC
jgi:hypothetical protein